MEWYLEIINGEGTVGERFLKGFKGAMRMLALAIIMLLAAAFVEAYITPAIASGV